MQKDGKEKGFSFNLQPLSERILPPAEGSNIRIVKGITIWLP